MGQLRPVRDSGASGRAWQQPRALPPAYQSADCPELDCLGNLLPAETLAAAAERADELKIGADRVLVAQGAIGDDAYLRRLSLRSGIRLADFSKACRADIDLTDDGLRLAAQSGILHMRIDGKPSIVATLRGDRARRLVRMAVTSPREIGHLRLTTEKALQDFLLYRTAGLIGHAIEGLHEHYPALSAAPAHPRSWMQSALRRLLIGGTMMALFCVAMTSYMAMGDLLALLFLAAIALRAVSSFHTVEPLPALQVEDQDLPDYSIVVALYREAPSVPQLLAALTALDYPREKLDILLVVETDDLATRAAIARARPPSFVRVIVAPNDGPRTKPKALNVALPFARGRFVAVFDAEDKPDPDQLRMALAAFRNGDDDLVCVQARLAIENSGDSFFTRIFAAEYAGQFDIVMPGYDRFRLPWPLGGTSNHFRTDRLREVCAWDPYNVTEDADLGLRFARFGYRTATIDSTTWEEAPVAFWPWVKQRTRWMKGWMQTWWIHARHPLRFWRRTTWRGLIARDLIIGGALLAALAYPFLVIIGLTMLCEYGVTGELAHTLGWVSPLHLASIVAGFGLSVMIQLRGLAYRGRLRHGWVLALTPIYWACLSWAAWRALLQLRSDPYKWEKTEHGLAKEGSELAETVAASRNMVRDGR